MEQKFYRRDETQPYNRQQQEYLESGHVWEVNETGDIDVFAYEGGDIHNGPRCTVCDYGRCWHCTKTVPKCKGAPNAKR